MNPILSHLHMHCTLQQELFRPSIQTSCERGLLGGVSPPQHGVGYATGRAITDFAPPSLTPSFCLRLAGSEKSCWLGRLEGLIELWARWMGKRLLLE